MVSRKNGHFSLLSARLLRPFRILASSWVRIRKEAM